MPAEFRDGGVRADCPDCGALSRFEGRDADHEFGFVDRPFEDYRRLYRRTVYRLMRCAGCSRGALAAIRCDDREQYGQLIEFYPLTRHTARLPAAVPEEIVNEFREAELCAAVRAWRAGSAMLRSALEKTLTVNGYTGGNLKSRIDAAATDGVITAARRQRAHDEIRVLGNDVLHDQWREVSEDEYDLAHHYTQRILEDFYDHREEVVTQLQAAQRLPRPPAA
jgi:hypothetical protein